MIRKKLLFLSSLFILALQVNIKAQSTNCATATAITLVNGNACVNGTTVGAVSDNVLWGGCNVAPVNEVWYTFVTSGSNNTFTVTPNTLTNTEFVLLTGGCYPTGTLQTCNTVVGSAINNVVWGLPPGIQVWIGIASNQGNQGTFQFCINSTPPAPSPGFTCATSIPLCTMNTFTLNPMLLNSSGQTPSCFLNPTQRDIWYEFTITQAGSLAWIANPINPTDEFDWALWDVTAGCPGTIAACNYNYAGGSSQGFGMQPTVTVCPTSGFAGPSGEFCPPLNVVCGRTYAIQISNYTNTNTGFTFAWTGSTCMISSNAAFTPSPTFACAASLTVNINNTSTGTCPGESWTFGDGSPTYNGTAPPPHTYTTPGTYAITATIGGICPSTVTHYIQLYGPLAATTTHTNVSCPGGCNGTATIATVSGGDGVYTYSWAPGGATTTSISGLCAGTYTLTVFNAACSSSVTNIVTITQPPVITAAITQVNVLCNGSCTGTATVTAGGGTPGYTYSWSTTPSQSGITATGLCAGTYTVTVKDANNCTQTATVIITQPPVLTATTTQVNVLCNGVCSGTATVTASGGTPAYIYSWTTIPSQATVTATGLCAGTYSCIVKDANNCTITKVVTITQPTLLTAATSQVNALCNGSCTGTATVTASGGTPAYSYSWNTTPVQTTVTATGLCAGSYTVTVTDANGCTITKIYSITQPTAIALTTSTTPSTCSSANGSATVNASGGTPAYTYSWTTTPVQTTATASGIGAGNYTVIVTDANGCTSTTTVVVTTSSGGTASISASVNVLCFGGNNGSATVTMTGGTAPFTYSWNTAPVQTTQTATGLSAGSYTVTVTDANGCIAVATITITQPVALTATQSQVNLVCFAQCNGTATVTVAGGTSPYSYAWSPSGGNAATATGLCAGSYTCIITDAHGCLLTKTFTITQPAQLVLSVAGFNATCNGTCNGQGVCIPSGGTPGYTYSWAPTGGNNPSATGLCVGIYTVFVTDQNGCSANDTAMVNQPTAITATTSSTQSTCSSSNGTATVVANGGTPAYNYSWNSTPVQTTATATGLAAGSYTVTITDAHGCTHTATVIVTTANGGTASISTSVNVLCFGGNNGSATVTMTGGTAPFTYSWNTTPVQTTQTATGLSAGSYTITVTDANGCVATANITITQPAQVTASISASVNVLCNGGNNGSATVSAGGGTPGYTYSWNTTPVQNSATATGLSAGSYTVTVTDANGCIITATIIITQPTLLTVNAVASPAVICIGQPSNLTTTTNGGTPAYSFAWMPGNMTGSTITVTPTATTTYSVTTTDANGCTATNTVTVTVNPLPVVTFTTVPNPATGCAPLCVTFTNTTPNSVSCFWNLGDNNFTTTNCNPTHCYTNAGTYDVSLTVTNTNGCTNTLTMPAYVQVYPLPVADFSMSPQPTTVLNGTIHFTDLSTGSPNQWLWNFGDPLHSTSTQQNPSITYADSGTYSVLLIVTTQYGCVDSVRKTLRIDPEFMLYVPNAFTPSGDANNETFFPKGSGIDESRYKLWVFDRWGKLIFYTETWNKHWDGRANGGADIAQEDVYVWKIEVYDFTGQKHNFIGHVSLIK